MSRLDDAVDVVQREQRLLRDRTQADDQMAMFRHEVRDVADRLAEALPDMAACANAFRRISRLIDLVKDSPVRSVRVQALEEIKAVVDAIE